MVLSIETSGRTTQLGVLNDKKTITLHQGGYFKHAESLLFLWDILTKKVQIEEKIKLVCVSVGPGFFTALRAGLSFAKALSYSLGVPIVGVPTLNALAIESSNDHILAFIMIKRDKIFYSRYERKGEKCLQVDKIHLTTLDNFPVEEGIQYIGTPNVKILHRIKNFKGAYPRAKAIGLLGKEMHKEKGPVDPGRLEPLYVYTPDYVPSFPEKSKD